MQSRNGGPQIVIIGAGPSGLATAYFLKKRGYQNVLILEKAGRVGGLCDTITCQGFSFDLGANYVTPAYTEVLKMAREVGAKFYSERPFIAMTVPADGSPATYQSMFNAVRVDQETGKTIPALRFLWLLAKYTWIRWRLADVIDKPTFAGVENHPDVCQGFGDWLDQNGPSGLRRLFELPVTMMGYGTINGTPALYALKFMTVQSFVPMALKEAPLIGNWLGWPKRFVQGFQRFWERIAWDLDVRLDVTVTKVTRTQGRKTVVEYVQHGQKDEVLEPQPGEIECDYLVLACPQSVLLGRTSIICDEKDGHNDQGSFIELTEEERSLFEEICEVWYCMTTYHVQGLTNVGGGSPLAAAYPLAPVLYPRGVAKQWKDCNFVQYYSPISSYDVQQELEHGNPDPERKAELLAVLRYMKDPEAPGEDPVKKAVLKYVRQTTGQMNGSIDDDNQAWHTYNRFLYFQHVNTRALEKGFYTQLENMQGTLNTFYVGGATNFELVEPIVEYAKNMVHTHFPYVS